MVPGHSDLRMAAVSILNTYKYLPIFNMERIILHLLQ